LPEDACRLPLPPLKPIPIKEKTPRPDLISISLISRREKFRFTVAFSPVYLVGVDN